MASGEVEPTKNKAGFSFLRIIEAHTDPWLNSLPNSSKPLADLGACYGVHVIHALKHGRDVIALDACAEHISILQQRVAAAQAPGKLIDVKVTTLPDAQAFESNSLAGILLSEVLHFLPLHAPQELFKHCYNWLEPGGILNATSASALLLNRDNGKYVMFDNGRTWEQAMQIIHNPPPNIAQLAPGFVHVSTELLGKNSVIKGPLYCLTREELCFFAENVGFVVEKCVYERSDKYTQGQPYDDSMVWLVARKPTLPT